MEGGLYDYPTNGMDVITDQDLAFAIYAAVEFANSQFEFGRDQVQTNDRFVAVSPYVNPELVQQSIDIQNQGDPAEYIWLLPTSELVDMRIQYDESEFSPEGGDLTILVCQHLDNVMVDRTTGTQTPRSMGTVERVYTYEWQAGWLLVGIQARNPEMDVFSGCPMLDTPFERTS